MPATYIAFRSSPALRQDSRRFLRNLALGAHEPQSPLIASIMGDFTDELLQVFMLDIIHLMKLSPFMNKLVHGTVSTIKSTVHGATRAVVHKLSNQQLQPLAEHVRGLMLNVADEQGVMQPWVGFAIDEAFHQRLRRLIAQMRLEHPENQEAELTACLREVTDRAIAVYIDRPTQLVGLGFVMRKVADGAASVIHKASHALIAKLIPDLEAGQYSQLADYMEGLLLSAAQPEPAPA